MTVEREFERTVGTPLLDSPAWLRMQLLRLKAGIPVDVSLLPSMTVGLENLTEKLNKILDKGNRVSWMAVAGEFGAGKSHFLGLARHVACAKGWAVCFLVANTADGSLAQPQRHIPFMLDTMVSPYGSAVGIVELFNEWWNGIRRSEIVQWARANAGTLHLADALISLQKESLTSEAVCEYLGAKMLGARTSNPIYRRAAYHHLVQVISLLRAIGHTGLLLLIDEVESVFRLATSRSWLAALRTLSTYCCNPLLGDLRLVFMATREARHEIQAELPGILQEVEYQISTPREEKLALCRFAEEVKRFGWDECPHLQAAKRIALVRLIADLHFRANGKGAPLYPPLEIREWLSRRDVNVRYAVRMLLTWLDSYA